MDEIIPRASKPVPDLDKFLKKETVNDIKTKEARLRALAEIEGNVDGNYTVEQLQMWKALGLQRPGFVTTADWRNCDLELTPLKRFVCHCAAVLFPIKDIATMTGFSVNTVQQLVSSQVGEAEIKRIQDEVYGGKFQKMFEQITPMAIQTALEVMSDSKQKGSTRVDAAFRFMDRALGKPKQAIEVEDNVARNILMRLDAMSKEKPTLEVDVEKPSQLTQGVADSKVEDKPILDEVDQWFEGNLKNEQT